MIEHVNTTEHDHWLPKGAQDINQRTLKNFRLYVEYKFGHGIWHTLMRTGKIPRLNELSEYYNQDSNDGILIDVIYLVANYLKFPAADLYEDFNLFIFKNRALLKE